MTAKRWTTVLFAFAAVGSLAVFNTSHQTPEILLSAVQSLAGHAPTQALHATPIQFRQERHCAIPILHETRSFQGGLTSGERITISLNTEKNTFRFRTEAAWHAGRPSRLRTGNMTMDDADCTYVLNSDEPTRVAVNKDGVLFGSIDFGGSVPVRIVAFSEISQRMADLAGAWRIIGDDGMSTRMQEARIRLDGTFSRCSLTHSNPMQCVPDTGRITLISDTFQATDSGGHGGTLVVGKVAGQAVPIMLRPDDPDQGLRFLVRQPDFSDAAKAEMPANGIPRQQIQIIAPTFHGR